MTAASATGGPSLLVLELGLTLLIVIVAGGWRRFDFGSFRRIERALGALARRKALSVAVVGISACALRLLLLPISPIPHPFINDDFSYLLAGDTFASGRLTNATHPMWIHFESFHITQIPSYMSMYFPAQGIFLAAGQAIAGHPWWGVWAANGFMCAAICWMLQGWLPPGWALLGGGLAIARISLFSYWVDSYWGGAVSAIGGALVLGAVPRIRRRFLARDFFWMALGMSILANSRPYEGLILTVAAFGGVVWWLFTEPHPALKILALRAAPAATLLILVSAFIGYYNYRVFGKVLTTSYSANRAQYSTAPHFLWQSERPEPAYRHEVLRKFYTGLELDWFRDIRTPRGFVRKTLAKFGIAGEFYFGVILLPPFVMLPKVLRDRHIRFLILAGGLYGIGLLIETWLIPHYIAPFAAGVYAILLQCMRHLRAGRKRSSSGGLFLVRAIPAACAVLVVLRVSAQPLGIELPGAHSLTAYGAAPLGLARAQVLADLAKQPGGQLAMVRYSQDHDVLNEWVYNAADIDRSKVVWAREMDAPNNLALIDYFRDRTVWLVEPDFNPAKVTSYPTMQELRRVVAARTIQENDNGSTMRRPW